MNAGRELDAMVAKQIFGSVDTMTPYSSEIWAAWKVVEKMTQEGWHFDCNYYPDDLSWVIVFWKPGMTFGETTVSGIPYTEPKGICLAALKVLGVHVEAQHT